MKSLKYILITIIVSTLISCKVGFSLSGGSIPEGTETFQVNFFQNNSPYREPGTDRDFTNALSDFIRDITPLELVTSNGDLVYEGEITDYRIQPTNATSANTAAQNRLTVRINVRFLDKNNPDTDFEQPFSFFFDFDAGASFTQTIRTAAEAEIFERITQDIYQASLANW